MGVLILLGHRVCHVNSFSTGVFSLQVDPIFFNIRKINLSLLNVVCFIPPNCLCFPAHPPLFLQGIRCLNQLSILLMGSLFILFRQCSYLVILRKILTELKFIILCSLSSLVDSIQVFGVDHIPFIVSNTFSCRGTS